MLIHPIPYTRVGSHVRLICRLNWIYSVLVVPNWIPRRNPTSPSSVPPSLIHNSPIPSHLGFEDSHLVPIVTSMLPVPFPHTTQVPPPSHPATWNRKELTMESRTVHNGTKKNRRRPANSSHPACNFGIIAVEFAFASRAPCCEACRTKFKNCTCLNECVVDSDPWEEKACSCGCTIQHPPQS